MTEPKEPDALMPESPTVPTELWFGPLPISLIIRFEGLFSMISEPK